MDTVFAFLTQPIWVSTYTVCEWLPWAKCSLQLLVSSRKLNSRVWHKAMVVYCVVFILMPVFATHLLFQIAPWLSSSSLNDGHCGQSKLCSNRWPKMGDHLKTLASILGLGCTVNIVVFWMCIIFCFVCQLTLSMRFCF